MSLHDDIQREAAAPLAIDVLGDEGAVVVGEKLYAAIVGALRVERIPSVRGGRNVEEEHEICQLAVRCPAGTIGPRDALAVPKYATEGSPPKPSEEFVVVSVRSVGAALTVLECARRWLAKIEQKATGN